MAGKAYQVATISADTDRTIKSDEITVAKKREILAWRFRLPRSIKISAAERSTTKPVIGQTKRMTPIISQFSE